MADWTDYFSAAMQLYDAYNKSKDPKFKQIPEDPTLTALRAKVLGYIDNSPTRNAFGSMLGSQMQNMGKGFTNPAGKNGFTPYSSPPVKYDLSKILPNIYGATGANPTNASTPVTQPVGGSSTFTPGDLGSTSPDPNADKHRVPNMAPPPNGASPGGLMNTPQVFDPNMQGRPGVTSPAGQNPNIIDIQNRNNPGLGTPGGTGAFNTDIDLKGFQDAWNNLPTWAKASIGIGASLLAAQFGIPIGAAMKLAQKFTGGSSQPQTGNQNTYNQSNPTQPVLP